MPTKNPSSSNRPNRALIKETLPVTIDKKAEEENKNIESQARRTRREQDVLHWAFVILVWLVVASVFVAFFAKVWHILAPSAYGWLDEAHLKNLDAFLTTGILSGGVGAFFKSKLAKSTD